MKYFVMETVWYEVDADSEETAEQLIIDSVDRDKWCFAVTERQAMLPEDAPLEVRRL